MMYSILLQSIVHVVTEYLFYRWNVMLSTKVDPLPVENYDSIYYSSRLPAEFYVTIKENTRTTAPSHFQDVRLIKFQTNGETYGPGDVLCLRPKNLPLQVREFQRVLEENGIDIKPNTVFNITATTSEVPVPSPLKYEVTFQQLCEEYFDLTAIPRRYTFSILSQLTDSELEKEKCEEFTTAEGQQELYSYCNRPRRNIVEVLKDFPHATKNLTKEMLFEILTPIKPRDFSIASSYAKYRNEIHILVAVVKYKTKLVKERLGLCSNYLADLKIGDKISVWLKKGSFSFPNNTNNTVIMVGPGTGIAPFRNYIQECAVNNSASKDNLILFFGCRGKYNDFHCGEEFTTLQKQNKLNLICAFSRDQENKVYVQHKILEEGSTIWNAMKDNKTCIFVAGNSKNMPQEVREAFLTSCMEHGNLSKEEAEKLIQDMERKNKYQTETWF
ncbi:nitric oxide synthase-related [Holotrichia oblita]|uniref:Nitric oxide synthase-related n=1 Tax=Holotrichia oblita TaxID=644536 RepID=A0ACB9T491_HOLOL|nr:nitric oxide synthase-related [Holotrichia oblita]